MNTSSPLPIGVTAGEIERRNADPRGAKRAAAAADGRFRSFWLPQGLGFDAIGVLQQVGTEAPTIELGVAVVPIQFEHPASLAARALTANDAVGGRFVLGVGVSHPGPLAMRGLPYRHTAAHMGEYLQILGPLLTERSVDFRGEHVSAQLTLEVPTSVPPPQLLVAALGPRMLAVAGRYADGTTLSMTGPRTVAEHVVPRIHEAAADAGRPAPRVIAGLPVCVTTDTERAKATVDELWGWYVDLPAYRAVLDREGVRSPVDVAVIGDESTVADALGRLADAGATDFVARVFGTPDECARTFDVLASL